MLKGSPMVDPKNNIRSPPINIPPPNLPFFTEQLAAFEIWLEFAAKNGDSPTLLPILLQVLLSPTHRLKALLLLKKYLALGPAAVHSTLFVGLSPYILKLLQSPAADVRQILVCIWAFIVGFDPSCRNDLIKDKSQSCFIQYMTTRELSASHRCLATFVLAEICNKHPEGQQTCLQQGLHRSCVSILSQPEVMASSSLKQWTCLCIAKLCEDYTWAKYLCLTESLNNQIYHLLTDHDPLIRASVILALGEFFGASNVVQNQHQGGFELVDPRELRESELKLALQLLECCTDGCIKVRRETIVSLSKFVILPAHLPCFIVITRMLLKFNVRFLFTQSHDQSPSPSAASNAPAVITGSSSAAAPSQPVASTAPILTATSIPLAHAQRPQELIWPWNIAEAQTHEMVEEIKLYLATQGIGRTPPGSPSSPSRTGVANETQDVAGTIATAYCKFWLALCGLQCKDPSLSVVLAISAIFKRIYEEISFEDLRNAAKPNDEPLVASYDDDANSSFSEY